MERQPTRVETLQRANTDQQDAQDVAAAVAGERTAVERLVVRHQGFLYNVILKMRAEPEEAEDLTQDVLLKLITRLDRFDPAKGRFRTWAYRIAFHHVLNSQRGKREERAPDFEAYFDGVAATPNDDTLDVVQGPDGPLFIEEAKIGCMSGMLLCLDREQRLTYILGAIFQLEHRIAAEVFGISPAAYRKRLERARHDLSEWMHKRCGLINPKNACRCARKTKHLLEVGAIKPGKLTFQRNVLGRIETHATDFADPVLREIETLTDRLFREHPYTRATKELVLAEILDNPLIRTALLESGADQA